MHTALRLGVRTAQRIRRANPDCRIVFHGLYALLNAEYLLAGIADYVLGGEFEESFVDLVKQLMRGESPRTTYDARRTRLEFPIPSRDFFVVPPDVVLGDIRRLIAAGARHITFGDPDFLNGPGHARKLVRALHAEFPGVTYDFTAKI